MAVPANTVLTYAQIGIKEDVRDALSIISPTDFPLQAMAGTRKVDNRSFDWQTYDRRAPQANAQLEGDDATITARTQPVRLTNVAQIFTDSMAVSGTSNAVSVYGRTREMTLHILQSKDALRSDIETAFLSNQAPVAGAAGIARQTRPLCGWYTSATASRGVGGADGTTSAAATDGTQRAFTKAQVDEVIRKIYTEGGKADTIMVHPEKKQQFSAFTVTGLDRQESAGTNTLQAAIDFYVSDFGKLKIVPNRYQRARDVHILDLKMLNVAYLREMMVEDLAKTGDSVKAQVIAECGLENLNPRGSGIVADLT